MNYPQIETIDILSPAFKEEKHLPDLTKKVETSLRDKPGKQYQLHLLVNEQDPSDTVRIAKKLAREHQWVKIRTRHSPPSFGRAITDGIYHSKADAIVICMGDCSDDPKYIPRFIDRLEDGFDVVHGSRFKEQSVVQGYPRGRLVLNRCVNLVAKWYFGLNTNDLTNAYKAYRTRVFNDVTPETLTSEGFAITIELALRTQFQGYSHDDIPVTWESRKYGTSRNFTMKEWTEYVRRISSLALDHLFRGSS